MSCLNLEKHMYVATFGINAVYVNKRLYRIFKLRKVSISILDSSQQKIHPTLSGDCLTNILIKTFWNVINYALIFLYIFLQKVLTVIKFRDFNIIKNKKQEKKK